MINRFLCLDGTHTANWLGNGGLHNGAIVWKGSASDSWKFECLSHDDPSCPDKIGCAKAKRCSDKYRSKGVNVLVVNGKKNVGNANCCRRGVSVTKHSFRRGKYLIENCKNI